MSWKLKAKREILPPYYTVTTYEEIVEVREGIAIVNTVTAKDRLLRSGAYDLVEEEEENQRISDVPNEDIEILKEVEEVREDTPGELPKTFKDMKEIAAELNEKED